MDKVKQVFEINGHDFERMVRNGLANLSQHVDEINALNVFPVPDGDTGSNMYLTLKNAVDQAEGNRDLHEYLRSLSAMMLLGARGNSGVILSQLFKGFAERLQGKDEADAGDLCAALISAYKTAYASVKRPVEGTMLTVAREGIEKSRSQIKRNMPIDRVLSFYLVEMRRSLSYTPTLLLALREAGVVDSGGMGYILIIEGMQKELYGEAIQMTEASQQLAAPAPAINTEGFDADAEFTFGYCTEFLLQLLKSHADIDDFDPNAFSDALGEFGDSIVVVQDGDRVKVHVHTQTPAKAIEYAQRYGEFISFKLENMHLQHSRFVTTAQKKHFPIAVLAACNGDGMARLYKEFDYCRVINGGELMNVSCQEFINAFDSVDADHLIVLPNNKNTISAAQQAAKLSKNKNISVLSSANVVQGYLALSMDMPSDTVEERITAFHENVGDALTVCVARAVRASVVNGETCNAGDYLAFMNGKVIARDTDVVQLIQKVVGAPEMDAAPEVMQIFWGAAVNTEQCMRLGNAIEDAFAGMEIIHVDSGHAIYDLIISLS
ncbi:MAG: DAK2 domain-containing protein [Clostridiales bacterium]|nr:DAK2 domain-containing protein [Clostridiales bacterium]